MCELGFSGMAVRIGRETIPILRLCIAEAAYRHQLCSLMGDELLPRMKGSGEQKEHIVKRCTQERT